MTDLPPKPNALPVRYESIPRTLKALPNWCVWKYEPREDKKGKKEWGKFPYKSTLDYDYASSNKPETWLTFSVACALYESGGFDGLWFALPLDRSMSGGDFDHCLDDGTIIVSKVVRWINDLNTYTEISPSGDGIRTVELGPIPSDDGTKKGDYEMYDHGRFLSITGHHLDGYPETINECPGLEKVFYEIFPKEPAAKKPKGGAPTAPTRTLTRGDKLLLTIARKEQKFKQLFDTDNLTITYKDKESGRKKAKTYDSASEAEAALFCKTAYWTNGDPVRALRIVLTSERERGKWESPRTGIPWVEKEIAKACDKIDDGFKDADVIDYLEMGSRGLVVSPDRVAKEILAHNHFLTPKDTREIHVFDEWIYESEDGNRRIGIYKDQGIVLIDAEARKLLKHRFATSNVKEITAIIRADTYCDRDVFDSAPLNLLPLNNGVYDLKSGTLTDYSPEIPFFFIHAGGYHPTLLAKETEAKKCIEKVLPVGDTDGVTDAMVFQEIGGSAFYRAVLWKIALMFFGPSDSGKSILLAILRNAVGKKARARKTLQDLTENRFAEAALYHVTLNVAADIGSLGINNIGKFNELMGGVDTQNCEKKGKDGFEFESYATQAFSTNDLPTLSPKAQKAEKEAFYSRWVLIETTRKFVKNPNPDIPNEIKDEGKILGELLKKQENLDWATTWFIVGLRRALKNHGYSQGDSGFNVKERWVQNTDSLAAFAATQLEHTPGFHTRAEDFTQAYKKYCVETEMVEASDVMIGRRLPHLIPGTEKYESHGKWWRNLSIKGKSPIKDSEGEDDRKSFDEPIDDGETRLKEYWGE